MTTMIHFSLPQTREEDVRKWALRNRDAAFKQEENTVVDLKGFWNAVPVCILLWALIIAFFVWLIP